MQNSGSMKYKDFTKSPNFKLYRIIHFVKPSRFTYCQTRPLDVGTGCEFSHILSIADLF
jgi:hypothetical protein